MSMTPQTRATKTKESGLLEAAAIALAGLTVAGALIQTGANRTTCAVPPPAGYQQSVGTVQHLLDADAIRDMRLHD
jgi:hypothetical protein